MIRSLSNLSTVLAASAMILFLSCGSAFAEVLTEFHSDMQLLPSGAVNVYERFKVDFRKDRQRNQIIRYIKTRYHRGKKIHDVEVKINKILMDANPGTYSMVKKTGDELQIHIGNREQPLTKVHEFEIEYEVYRAVNFIKSKPELFIDVTGDQWPFDLRNVTCDLTLPRGVKPASVKAFSYIGAPGNYSRESSVTKGDKLRFSARAIRSGKGLAVLADLPPGSVILPSVTQDIIWRLQSGAQIFVLPLGTLLTLTLFWWITARPAKTENSRGDAELNGIDSWRPPEYLTPCEVGTLIDESCDLSDIGATVVDLAARGFLKIRILPYNGLLYLCDRDYELTLVRPLTDRDLKPHEKMMLTFMFGLSGTTYVSGLRGRFIEYLPLIKTRVYKSLLSGGYFTRDPNTDRRNFVSVGALVLTLGLCLMAASTSHAAGLSTACGIIFSGIVIIIASAAMPRLGAPGTRALKQIVNFRNFLAHGDKERVEAIVRKDPQDFFRYLSYAIVLGVADRFAAVAKDVVREYPEWFEVDESIRRGRFSSVQFVKELGDALIIINRAMTEKHLPGSSVKRMGAADFAKSNFKR